MHGQPFWIFFLNIRKVILKWNRLTYGHLLKTSNEKRRDKIKNYVFFQNEKKMLIMKNHGHLLCVIDFTFKKKRSITYFLSLWPLNICFKFFRKYPKEFALWLRFSILWKSYEWLNSFRNEIHFLNGYGTKYIQSMTFSSTTF